MEKKKANRFRLVYRRSSLAVKILVLATVVLCTAVLITLGIMTHGFQKKTAEANARNAELEQENQKIQQDIDELGTPQSDQRIVYEELDLVDPDTIIFETTE